MGWRKDYREKWLDDAQRSFSDWDNNGHEWHDQPYEEVLSAKEQHKQDLEDVEDFIQQLLDQRDEEIIGNLEGLIVPAKEGKTYHDLHPHVIHNKIIEKAISTIKENK